MKHAARFRMGARIVVVPGFATAALAEEFGRVEASGDLEFIGTVESVSRTGLRALAAGGQTRRLVARMGGQPGTGDGT